MKEHYSSMIDAAEEVRDFYEPYPYPRPVESLEQYRLRPLPAELDSLNGEL